MGIVMFHRHESVFLNHKKASRKLYKYILYIYIFYAYIYIYVYIYNIKCEGKELKEN